MSKGRRTRVAIVEAALEQASANGLEGLTIGALAERMKMSKSGVFAHFGSREDLQIAVLRAYEERFIADVLKAAVPVARGLPRLVALLRHWLAQTEAEARYGCIWISGASEYDDRPGAVRDELVRMIDGWRRELGRAIEQAVAVGHLVPTTRVDELIFNVNGVILALHHDARLLRSPDASAMACRSLDHIIDALRTPAAPALGLVSSPSLANPGTPAIAANPAIPATSAPLAPTAEPRSGHRPDQEGLTPDPDPGTLTASVPDFPTRQRPSAL